MNTLIRAFVVLSAALLSNACYESPEVSIHEAGVYKGDSDPLTQGDAQERAQTLADRFERVQVDR